MTHGCVPITQNPLVANILQTDSQARYGTGRDLTCSRRDTTENYATGRCWFSIAFLSALSMRRAASSCIPGRTCEYTSKVMPTVLWPRLRSTLATRHDQCSRALKYKPRSSKHAQFYTHTCRESVRRSSPPGPLRTWTNPERSLISHRPRLLAPPPPRASRSAAATAGERCHTATG